MPSVVDKVAPWRGYICLENRRSRFKSQPTTATTTTKTKPATTNKQIIPIISYIISSNGTIKKSEISHLENEIKLATISCN